MTIGSGLAIAGIWLGVGIAMLSGKEVAGIAALCAMFATFAVAAVGKGNGS